MKNKNPLKLQDLSLPDHQLLEKIGQEILFNSRKKILIQKTKQNSNHLKP
jgi:hypothetical protein